MKIKLFTSLTRNLLSNLRRTCNIFLIIERCLSFVVHKLSYTNLFKADMEQDDREVGQQQEQQQQPDRVEVMDVFQRLLDADLDEDDYSDEPMDEDDDTFDDDEDSLFSMDEDDSATSATDSDNEANWTNPTGRRERHILERQLRYLIYKDANPRPMSIYTFQPLKLLKVNHKFRLPSAGIPVSRSGHRVIASESHLYSLGGYNPRSALSAARRNQCLLFQELWSYNFATKLWKLLLSGDDSDAMPTELASNALAIHNNVLISHGGTGYPFGESCSNDCYVYTTGRKPTVAPLEVSGDLPTAQYGPGIVIHEHYLYTIGGTTGFDYSCDVYRLNMFTKVWENLYICRPEMRDDPEGRYRHEVVYDGHYIYVLGGGTSHTVYDLQKIPAFNLKTNRWDYFETLPDRTLATSTGTSANQDATVGFPKPRKCFSCVQHTRSDGDIEAFITGGLQGDFTTYFGDIWKLNLRTKQWTWIRTASLRKPLYFHSAAHAGNGCMYIFGGIEYNQKEMRRRNDLYKMWMTIPKLSEMCWDAITYYNENMDSYSRDTLIRVGIPEKFVRRMPESHDKGQFRYEKLSLSAAIDE